MLKDLRPWFVHNSFLIIFTYASRISILVGSINPKAIGNKLGYPRWGENDPSINRSLKILSSESKWYLLIDFLMISAV